LSGFDVCTEKTGPWLDSRVCAPRSDHSTDSSLVPFHTTQREIISVYSAALYQLSNHFGFTVVDFQRDSIE
jgi:hypothetical protein